MGKITSIAAQQKNKNRVSVFVDKKYSFSLTLDELAEQKLVAGPELSEADITRLKKLSQDGKMYERALNKLARRQHSVKEIHDYLKQKDCEEELSDQIVEKLLSKNYLNDEEFAEMWIRNRRSSKSRSNRMLRSELFQKGVDAKIIDAQLEDSEDEEMQALRELIEKKSRQSRYKDEEKLIQYLMSKGYVYSKIQEALSS